MIELPGSLRDLVIERVDEELEVTGADSADAWTECVLAGLEALAEEMEEDIGENLVSKLEESGELEQSLSRNDHLKSENASLKSRNQSLALRLSSVEEELMKVKQNHT